VDEARLGQVVVDRAERARRDGEVVDAIAARAVGTVELLELLAELAEVRRVLELARHVVQAAREVAPHRLVDGLAARELAHGVVHVLAELVLALLGQGEADDRHARRQEARYGEVVEGGEELPPREIARRAEDDEHARRRRALRLEADAKRVLAGDRRLHGSPSLPSMAGSPAVLPAVTAIAVATTTTATAITAATATTTPTPVAATATAATAEATTLRPLLGLVDSQRAAVERRPVHRLDRFRGFGWRAHRHEAEAPRLARGAIRHDVDVSHLADARKGFAHRLDGGGKRQIADVKTRSHVSLLSRMRQETTPEGAFNPSLLSDPPRDQEPCRDGEIRRVQHVAVTFEREPHSHVLSERATLPGERP
jgi:hypothetical protein